MIYIQHFLQQHWNAEVGHSSSSLFIFGETLRQSKSNHIQVSKHIIYEIHYPWPPCHNSSDN